jgi:hypothetical protein
VRDAFLIFLLVLAAALIAGYVAFVAWIFRTAANGDEPEVPGCLLLVITVVVGTGVLTILAAVGHAVGVSMSNLTGG